MRSPLDLDDLGPAVVGVGDDPGLRSGERHRGHAEVLDRHAQQRHRDALARGEQHVELAAAGVLGDVVGEAHEIVGRLAHRRDHDHDVVAGAPRARDVIGDGPDAIRVGDRGPAELLDEQARPSRLPAAPAQAPTGFTPGTFCARAQRRQASPQEGERAQPHARQREAGREAQQAATARSITLRRSCGAIFVGLIVIARRRRRRRQEEAAPAPRPRRQTTASPHDPAAASTTVAHADQPTVTARRR